MLIYIQWARAHPQDWEPLEVVNTNAWRQLPKKPEPSLGVPGVAEIDAGDPYGLKPGLDVTHPDADAPGWVNAVMCQGLVIRGDVLHIGVEGQTLVITKVYDDLEDWPGMRWAVQWRLERPASDPRIGGRINTVQHKLAWLEDPTAIDVGTRTSGGPVVVQPWASFGRPGPENLRRYGIWMTEELARAHAEATTPHSWEEWA